MKGILNRLFSRQKSYTIKTSKKNINSLLEVFYVDSDIRYEQISMKWLGRDVALIVDTTRREIKRLINDLHCKLDALQVLDVSIYKEKETVDLMLKRRRALT